MNTFLKTYRLALTPLSPIHIGCGEDFEPTNYVIEQDAAYGSVLYGFDPSRAVLNDLQKSKLTDAANKASLQAIQRFFKDNAKDFKAHADVLISVSSGVAQAYEQRVGRATNIEANGNSVFNQLFIERTSYTGQSRQPYIPGSSFKGAIRTAIVDDLNQGKRPQEDCKNSSERLEKRLFGGGEFQTSPMRLVKIADLMPTLGSDPARRVLYAVNLKKARVLDKDGKEREPKGIAARKECILHGQYRAFVADAVVPSLDPYTDSKNTPAVDLRPTDLRRIAKQSNTYNETRLRRELAVLDGRGFLNPDWKKCIERLLDGELKSKLASGSAFLIRLGRYGGAESKTLTGDGVAQIKIMQGRGQPAVIQSTTKTVWLAAERETEQKHLLPFGWAIVEIDPQEDDSPQLKAWCTAESKGQPDMAAKRREFEAGKVAAAKRKIELQQEADAREAAKLAEQIATQQRDEALANMTIQAREVELLRSKCQELETRLTGGSNYKKLTADANKPGLYQDATALVKKAVESKNWSAADKKDLADMLELWMPKVVAPWDAKDQRKKLKFATLRSELP